jgi:hypothetical protein
MRPAIHPMKNPNTAKLAPVQQPSPAHAQAGARTDTPATNSLQLGSVTRTLWPPAAGTKRWLQQYGSALLCVRYRRDVAGLRKVVTVELIVGTVARRKGQPGLQGNVRYPVRLPKVDQQMRAALKLRRSWWDPESGCWYLHGRTIEELQLADHICMKPRQNDKR